MPSFHSSSRVVIACLIAVAVANTLGCSNIINPATPISTSTTTPTTPVVATPTAKNLFYLNELLTSGSGFIGSLNILPVTSTGSPAATTFNFSSSNQPSSIAVDTVGNLYIGAFNPQNVVFVYAAGTTTVNTPTAIIPVPDQPHNITADPAGDIFVASGHTNIIYKFVKSSSGYTQTTITDANLSFVGAAHPGALAADAAGNLHILGANVANNAQLIDTFSPSNTTSTPTSTIALPVSASTSASSIAVDAAGDIFVTNNDKTSAGHGSSDIAVYTAGTAGSPSAPARDILLQLPSGTQGAFSGISIDSAGFVYSIFDEENIATETIVGFYFVAFSPTANGPATPTYQFTLPANTGFVSAENFVVN